MKVTPLAATLLALLGSVPLTAHAQSAAQYNRAAQAIQLCASPLGALAPECAALRGGLAAPTAVNPYAAAGAANSSTVAAGLLGMATQAFSAARAAPAVPTPAPAPVGVDHYTASALATQTAAQAYQACVSRVGASNAVGVQGCIAQLQAASGGAPAAAAAFPGQGAAAPAAAAAISAFSALIGR